MIPSAADRAIVNALPLAAVRLRLRADRRADDPAALDPVRLAGQVGLIPDPWQSDVLRSSGSHIILN